MSDKLREAAQAARDAMRMAQRSHGKILLAYPPLDSWVHHRVDLRLNDAIKAVEDALAEPAQEPVGKFAKFTDGIWREVTDGSPGIFLYTAPPQPKEKDNDGRC